MSEVSELSNGKHEWKKLSEVSLRGKIESELLHFRYEEKEDIKRIECFLSVKNSCSTSNQLTISIFSVCVLNMYVVEK